MKTDSGELTAVSGMGFTMSNGSRVAYLAFISDAHKEVGPLTEATAREHGLALQSDNDMSDYWK